MRKYSCEKILNANNCGAVVRLEVMGLGGNIVITPHQLRELFAGTYLTFARLVVACVVCLPFCNNSLQVFAYVANESSNSFHFFPSYFCLKRRTRQTPADSVSISLS